MRPTVIAGRSRRIGLRGREAPAGELRDESGATTAEIAAPGRLGQQVPPPTKWKDFLPFLNLALSGMNLPRGGIPRTTQPRTRA